MKKNGMTGLIFSLGLIGLCSAAGSANASFYLTNVEPDGELKFYADSANADVSSFTGTVGGQHSGPAVTVDTIGNVDTDAGYGAIKPIASPPMKAGEVSNLTDVIFTPHDSSLFDGFFFRGQLVADGNITLVVDGIFGRTGEWGFFTHIPANTDFGPFGIIPALDFPYAPYTITSVELISEGFKELDQIDFSSAKLSAVPLPASLPLFGVALLMLGGAGAFSRSKGWFKRGCT
jgi:hypothetical protein